jgi:hypothetical protein
MRLVTRGVVLLCGVVLAACPGGPTPSACGASGASCCASNACDAGLSCVSGACRAPVGTCGGASQACCAGSSCGSGLACTQGTCQVPAACGGASQACCAGSTCGTGLACAQSVCLAAAPTCDAPFAEAGDVALPFAPESLVAADVDGDGKLDLIAAGGTTNKVAVLKGRGDGTFSAPVTYPASSPVHLAIADLDGDGRLDIAACGGGAVTILYGPTFAAASTRNISAGTRLMGIAAADLDADGKVDLVVADAASSTVSNVVVLLNQGGKAFTGQAYPAGDYPSAVAIADLNGDGIPDVVAADFYAPLSTGTWAATVAVLLGTGGGALASAKLYDTGTNSNAVAIGDLDGDGKPDLAVANLADSNPADVAVLHGKGDGTFTYLASLPTGSQAYDVRLADLDGDGRLDIVAPAYGSASASVFLGGAAGAFTGGAFAVGGGPTAAVPGDFDGDGLPDLAVAAFLDRSVRILRGAGDGSFGAPRVTRIGDGPRSMAAGDLDRDGTLDLVVAEWAGVSALLGSGDGGFRRSVVAAGSPTFVALADLNADGRLDVAWSDWVAATVTVALGNGDGTFTVKPSFAAGDTGPGGLAVGDLDKDGKVDLVVTTDSGAMVFLGRGDGTFTAGALVALLATMRPAARRVALVDLDGDGRLDLVAGGFDLYLAQGNGDGTFQAATTRGAYGVNDFLIADLNGDGAPDVAAAFPTVYTGPRVGVFPNQAGALGYSVSTAGPADPSAIASGDLDGDGRLDVAVTGGLAGDLLEVLLGRGDLTFPRTETLHAGDGVVDVVLGDFDGDGRLDAAVLSRYDDSVRVLPNRCP